MSPITRDPHILGGKPIVAGTRISVDLILEELGAGTDVLAAHPVLTREDVVAAAEIARGCVAVVCAMIDGLDQ